MGQFKALTPALLSAASEKKALDPLLPPTAHLIYTSDLEDSRVTDAIVWAGSKNLITWVCIFLLLISNGTQQQWHFLFSFRHTFLKSLSGAYTWKKREDERWMEVFIIPAHLYWHKVGHCLLDRRLLSHLFFSSLIKFNKPCVKSWPPFHHHYQKSSSSYFRGWLPLNVLHVPQTTVRT